MKAATIALMLTMLATAAMADEVAVGYESSMAVGRLDAAARARMAELPLQDLLHYTEGRHTMMKDDGISGHWGLSAVLARCEIGPRPFAKLRDADGTGQCERVIFADTGTGATLMLLTQLPHSTDGPADELNYFGKSNWAADGSLMVYARSARPNLWGPLTQVTTDTTGSMIVRANGTRPYIAFEKGLTLRPPICSPKRPDVGYAAVLIKRGELEISEFSFSENKVTRKLGTVDNAWWIKVSPDDKYLMGRSNTGVWVIRIADGKKWDVKLDQKREGQSWPIHDSYTFVPGNTDWFFYFYEPTHPGGGLRKEGQRLRNFKTGEEKVTGWDFPGNHGDVGRYFAFHTSGEVYEFDAQKVAFGQPGRLFWPDKVSKGNAPYYDIPHGIGGYAAHWPDDQRWAIATHYKRVNPEYLSEITRVFAKPLPGGGRVNRFRIAYTNLWGQTDRWGDPSISLDRPNLSPDGTKLLNTTNVFCRNGVLMITISKPLAPAQVRVDATNNGPAVTWEAPKYHAEIAGYRVYRSSESSRGFRLVSDELIKGTEFIDRNARGAGPYFYAVRSVEQSTLESSLSSEALLGVGVDKPLRVFCEAERAISAELEAPSPDAIWMNYEGAASDLYYIWQRRADKPGSESLTVNVPRAGKYYVVARMKGRKGAAFTIAGQDVAVDASDKWLWTTSAEGVDLKGGQQKIAIASSTYGSCLDCFYLATDADFKPTGRIVTEAPAALKLKSEKEGKYIRLTWTGAKDPRWHHYNLYVSDNPDTLPSQSTLLASPDKESYLDWQVTAGRPLFYRVTQVTLDGLESPTSNMAVATPVVEMPD